MSNERPSNVPSIVITPTNRNSDHLSASAAPSEQSFDEREESTGDVERPHKKPAKHLSCWQRALKTAKKYFHQVKSDVGLVILLVIYSLVGAAVFMVIEGQAEDKAFAEAEESEMVESRKMKRDLLDAVLNLTHCDRNHSEVADGVEWFLRNYEIRPVRELQGQMNETVGKPRQRTWTYFGSLFFCGTVFTTVGYGNIVPVTTVGRTVTMIYALFGIPLCLVVLSKLGKSLTKAIKFLWSFVRRLYYTGSCFRTRKTKGWRKLSLCERLRLQLKKSSRRPRMELQEIYVPYDVDDNFNLPPIVAILIAFLYIFLGGFMYKRWEDWTYLEAFYFTFTSLATIGFGDILPSHPKFFIAASAYILIGLSLIAMVINVIMDTVSETIVKATDHVKQQIISLKTEGLVLSPLYRHGLTLRPLFFRSSPAQVSTDERVPLSSKEKAAAVLSFRRHSI